MDAPTPPEPEVRASDAEREATVRRLRDAAGDGRLDLDELSDRTGAAYAATVRAELALLVGDLPATVGPAAEDLGVTTERRTLYGILGGDDLAGPMRLGGTCRVINVMGGVDLDLSQATIEDGVLEIRIISVMGGSTIRVPHGVRVERSGVSLLGGDTIEPDADDAHSPGSPVIRLHTFNLMGGNTVKRGPRGPSRWPWRQTIDRSPGGSLGSGA